MIGRVLFCLVTTAALSVAFASGQLIDEIPMDTIPDETRVVGNPIGLEGDVLVSGELETTTGVRFSDGSLQSTAAAPELCTEGTQSLTTNGGIYSNRIADFTPPEPYSEICFKSGDIFSDIHTVSESTAGGACTPGDVGWIIERSERSLGATSWTTARTECLKDGMRLPEYFEWTLACQNDTFFGVLQMTDNWEWASNEARFLSDGAVSGLGGATLGNGSCSHGVWQWSSRELGGTTLSFFRCAL